MPKRNRDLPNDISNQWPGVLDEIDIQVVPVEYISTVEIRFTDGNVWLVDVAKDRQNTNIDDIEASLEGLIEEYEEHIEGVNFVLDVKRVKQDIQKRTKFFMKKKK